jgi:hypothetical protein
MERGNGIAIEPDAVTERRDDADTEDADDVLADDELPAAERARMRRRDHDAAAHERELMNDGSAKWFKQVLDRQERAAREQRRRRTER